MRGMVHIVDDDASFRTAIGRLLRAHEFDTVEHESAEQFLRRADAEAAGGCVLLDMHMPGMSGPELQQCLARAGSPFAVIFLTGHGDIPASVQAIKAGAEDFLTKPVDAARLIAAIEGALARQEASSARLARLRAARHRLATLTPREREVFDQVVRGRLNKQAAHSLGISERTIKAHRQRVFDKLGLQSVAELALFAERLGVTGDEAEQSR